jgi:hypothetical protein
MNDGKWREREDEDEARLVSRGCCRKRLQGEYVRFHGFCWFVGRWVSSSDEPNQLTNSKNGPVMIRSLVA